MSGSGEVYLPGEREVYHSGERTAQALAGERERPDRLGRAISATIPPVAAAFLAERQIIAVAAADAAGRMWATLLSGPPGFVSVPDERTILITATPAAGDPLAEVLSRPAAVGTIALEPATRRRMRLNGRAEPTPDGLRVTAEQVFSNCPKYIQRRSPVAAPRRTSRPATHAAQLSTAQQLIVSSADTFFISTADDAGHADASHRGGNPGFVQVLGPRRLRWPDYRGNGAFMTLGNLESNPAAGLVFPVWETGGLLLLTGAARTDWTERGVEFLIDETVELAAAVPLIWSEPEYSPANP